MERVIDMPDTQVYGDIVVTGLEDTINALSMFEKQRLNDFLEPAMKKGGALAVKTEKSLIPSVTGGTEKGIHAKTSVEGLGWLVTEVNPFKGGSGVTGFVTRFLDFGARWSGRGDDVSTWSGVERIRNGEKIRSRKNAKPDKRNGFIVGLQQWAEKKLGLGSDESLQAAFAMRKSIIRKGLPGGKRIVKRTVEQVDGQVLKLISDAVAKFLEAIKK